MLSCDILDPVSVEKQSPLQLYDDLSMTEQDIRPKAKGVMHGTLLGFDLYSDPERVVRFHIFLKPNTQFSINQDPTIHLHAGHLGSLVLAGELVNQNFTIKESEVSNSKYGRHYISYTDNGEAMLNKDGNVNIKEHTSHVYKTGEHYHVAGELQYKDKVAYPIIDSDESKFHFVGNNDITVTLFGVDKRNNNEGNKRGTTRLMLQDGKEFGSTKIENPSFPMPNKTEVDSILKQADEKIRRELAEVGDCSTNCVN